jgi:hypothetical protein
MTTVTLINCFQVPAEREAEFLAHGTKQMHCCAAAVVT